MLLRWVFKCSITNLPPHRFWINQSACLMLRSRFGRCAHRVFCDLLHKMFLCMVPHVVLLGTIFPALKHSNDIAVCTLAITTGLGHQWFPNQRQAMQEKQLTPQREISCIFSDWFFGCDGAYFTLQVNAAVFLADRSLMLPADEQFGAMQYITLASLFWKSCCSLKCFPSLLPVCCSFLSSNLLISDCLWFMGSVA